jgi:type II secretory pathway component PulC
VSSIIAAHLFGAATDGNELVGKSDLPMVLVATFATSDPARGMAVLKEDPAGPGRLYVVGAQLSGGAAILREVRVDSVVLERSGRLETIAFARPANPLNLIGAAAMAAEGSSAEGGAGFEPVTEIVLQQRAEAAEQGEQIDTAVPGALPKDPPGSSP